MAVAKSLSHRLPLLSLLLAGLILRLVFVRMSLGSLPVTSDEALVILQAGEIAGGSRPLLLTAQPYMFPLDSYLLSLVQHFLPSGTLLARYLSLALGLLSYLGAGLLLSRLGPLRQVWPGLLLLVLPPAYLLMVQGAYAPPGYALLLASWTLGAWLGWAMQNKAGWTALALALLLGLSQGLGFSVLPSALALAVPLILWACLAGGLRQALARMAATGLGLAMGLWPALLALSRHAQDMLTSFGTRSLTEAVSWRWLAALHEVLGGVLGAYTCTYPDLWGRLALASWPADIFPAVFLALLAAALAVSLRGLAGRPSFDPTPVAGLPAALAFAPFLGLVLFLLNDRSHSGQFRYLLIVSWCLPFLWFQLYRATGKLARAALGATAVLLALLNLFTSVSLMGRWLDPGFAEHDAFMPDIGPALSLLRREGTTHCFAAHWTAYRLTVESGGAIVCSQPYNERFPNWPAPYRDEVRGDPRAAYVLTSPDSFDMVTFEAVLDRAGVARRRTKAGRYVVFDEFSQEQSANEKLVPRGQVAAGASHGQPRARLLVDGQRASKWTSGQGQEKGMWLELRLGQPLPVNRISLYYQDYAYDQAGSLRLSCLKEGRWQVILEEVPADLDPCEFANHLPLFGESSQTLRFAPVFTDALRLEIVSPRPDRLWTMAEIEVFCAGCQP